MGRQLAQSMRSTNDDEWAVIGEGVVEVQANCDQLLKDVRWRLTEPLISLQ